MSDPTPLNASINAVAPLPQSTTADGTTAVERSAADLIALDDHLAGSKALGSTGFGLRRQKISRGDALGRHS